MPLIPLRGTRYPFLCRSCRGGARPFLIRGKDAKAYQGEKPAVPLLGTSPPEIVCAKKNEVLSLCCAPISLWIASAFALQKLIREICMTLVYIFSMKSRAEQERLLSILQEIDKYKET